MSTDMKGHTLTTTKGRKVLYLATTAFAAIALTAIGTADVLRMPALIQGLTHLGYPAYLATILGTWKLLGVAAILAPGLPRVKEWAYAGLFFTLTGAAVSHAVSGDPLGNVAFPLVLLAVVIASWALLPARKAVVAVQAPARVA